MEDLFGALLEQLTAAPADPLVTETILVPGRGVARWLELRIAEHLGIAAGIDMPFLGAYLHHLSATDPCPAGPLDAKGTLDLDNPADLRSQATGEAFRREVLVLRIWRLLGERLHTPDKKLSFGAATDYCRDDPDGKKRLQLCTRLAACFDDYQLYRDDLLLEFAQGDNHKALSPHAPWQAKLWRALIEDAGLELPSDNVKAGKGRGKQGSTNATPFLFAEMNDGALDQDNPPGPDGNRIEHDAGRASADIAHRLLALRHHLDDANWRAGHLPERLSVFGTTTMPPAFLDVLHRMARYLPVHLYVPQPTPHYIGDLRERADRTGDNSLLSRFGTESREFADQLIDMEESAAAGAPVERMDLDDLSDEHEATTLLACLQQDIVQAFDRGERTAERFVLRSDDHTVRVHDCHSPQRELEVVRDQIFAAFRDDASLEARDVLVLVPDIDRYAPYAHAVFGPVQYQLPYHVADRHPARELPICRSLLSVLELAATRLTLAAVLHLLENQAVQRRFGLFASDVPVLRHLCHQAGIRWGLDGESREQQFDLPAFDDNAWLQGLDRLLLGTLTGPSDQLVLAQAPVADTTEARAELLQRFLSFARTLFAQIAILRHDHAFADWADRIEATTHALFEPGNADEEEAVQQLQRAAIALRSQARIAKHTETVPLVVLQDWLADTLAQGSPARGFLGGSITIAAMLPMRAVPVRCLFLCGLDDESFPRRDQPAPFDLLAAKPRPGDRNRRLDDRQLFLDLLMAARDQLHLSFVGHSAKDNAAGAPSVVLSELLDHVDRTCVRDSAEGRASGDGKATPRAAIVVQHPLQPWSERYRHGDDARLFTFSRSGTRLEPAPTRQAAQPWCPEGLAVLTDAASSEQAPTIQLDDLLQFWWHPCRYFLRNALRVRVRADDEHEESEEPFALDALTRYQLQDEAMLQAQRGALPIDDPLAWTRAHGVLPVGHHGDAAYHALRADTEQLLQEARVYARSTTRRIDLQLDGLRIVGTIEGFSDHDLVCMRVSKLKAKDRIKAWLKHLIVTLQRHQDAASSQNAAAGNAADDVQPWPTRTRVIANNGTKVYAEVPEPEARDYLRQLVTHFQTGQSRPLPFFENSSFEVGTFLTKGKDAKAAMRQGTKNYALKDRRDAWKYDEGDHDVALCMRERDPFAGGEQSEFFQLASTIWPPAIGYLQEPS